MTKKNQAVGSSPPLQAKNRNSFSGILKRKRNPPLRQYDSHSSPRVEPMKNNKKQLPKYAMEIVNGIKEYLAGNPICGKTADDFAEEAHISTKQLQRWFKESEGVGLKEYSDELRLEAAKQLLEEGEKPVKEVAKICLYRSHPYFSTVFKKKYGVTPKEWKQEHS
jgi:two-component system, response regulator YesN